MKRIKQIKILTTKIPRHQAKTFLGFLAPWCLGGYTFVICCALTGCDLFTTRAVESPSGSSGEGWILPTNPRAVIENLANSIGRRSDVDYMKSFTSEDIGMSQFNFYPDPQTQSNYPGKFDGWGNPHEQAFIQSLFSPTNLPLDSIAEFNFEVEQETVLGDSSSINAYYELYLGHLREAVARRIDGRLEFYLLRGNDGGWYIQRWYDVRIGEQPCWSDLKAQF